MKRMANALMASLKARIIDPEDPLSKKAMTQVRILRDERAPFVTCDHCFLFSQHLRAVLNSKDDKETIATMESELKQDTADPLPAESVVAPSAAGNYRCSLKFEHDTESSFFDIPSRVIDGIS